MTECSRCGAEMITRERGDGSEEEVCPECDDQDQEEEFFKDQEQEAGEE